MSEQRRELPSGKRAQVEAVDDAASNIDNLIVGLYEGRTGPFRSLARAVHRRQQLLRKLTDWRKLVTTQVGLAEAMGTSQPAIARLERGGGDPRVSTLERWAAGMGASIQCRLVIDEQAVEDSPHLKMIDVRAASASVLGGETPRDSAERLRRVRPMVVSISNKRDAKEREAARLAAQHRTPADLARLESALAELKAPPEAGFKDLHEFNRFRNAGREFHLAIAAASNNATLCADITELIDQLYWWLGHNVPHKKGQRDQHAAIVEAIRNQDANAAAEAMVVHSMNARDALDELLLHHLPSMTITTVLDMRQQAEGLAARLAAERHTPEDDQRLIKALSLTRDIPEGGFHTFEEAAAFREADRTLHMAIATAAHDPVVYNIVSVVYRNYSDLLSGIDLHLKGFRPRQTDDHATIVEAIREGRPDDAAKVTSDHIAFTRKVVDQELAALWFDLANAD